MRKRERRRKRMRERERGTGTGERGSCIGAFFYWGCRVSFESSLSRQTHGISAQGRNGCSHRVAVRSGNGKRVSLLSTRQLVSSSLGQQLLAFSTNQLMTLCVHAFSRPLPFPISPEEGVYVRACRGASAHGRLLAREMPSWLQAAGAQRESIV